MKEWNSERHDAHVCESSNYIHTSHMSSWETQNRHDTNTKTTNTYTKPTTQTRGARCVRLKTKCDQDEDKKQICMCNGTTWNFLSTNVKASAENAISTRKEEAEVGRYIHCQWILPGKINSLAVTTVSETSSNWIFSNPLIWIFSVLKNSVIFSIR